MADVTRLSNYINSSIPYAWDDSESWYEFLGKVLAKVNELVDTNNEYFNVPLAETIDTRLTQWETDGTLGRLVDTRLEPLIIDRLNTEVNAKNYGAIGDGLANDTAILQGLIDDIDAKGGGTLYLPFGTYRITSPLTTLHTSIVGEGNNPISWTMIKAIGCNGIVMTPEWGVTVKNISIQCDGERTFTAIVCNGSGVAPLALNYATIENVDLRNWKYGIDLRYSWNTTINKVSTIDCNVGVRLFGQSVNNFISDCSLVVDGLANSASIQTVVDGGLNGEGLMVSNCLLASGQYGILSSSFLSLNVVNCIIDLIKSVGIHLSGVKGFCLSNSWCYSTGDVIFSAASSVSEDQFCRVIGNTLTSVSGTSGIFIGDRNKNWIISNNYISAPNITIYMEYGTNGCVVTGNQIVSSYIQAILVVGYHNVIANNTGPGKVGVNSLDNRNILFNNLDMPYMIQGLYNSPPTAGGWKVGDIVYDASPVPEGYVGWICTVEGTPGTWKGFGLIQA